MWIIIPGGGILCVYYSFTKSINGVIFMKSVIYVMLGVISCTLLPLSLHAEDIAPHPEMRENTDGILKEGEYIIISPNGSITRALCPYTCEMRGLPEKHCRSWKSISIVNECYLQDTRIPSEAIKFPGSVGKLKTP
jgi:hypothetical protein